MLRIIMFIEHPVTKCYVLSSLLGHPVTKCYVLSSILGHPVTKCYVLSKCEMCTHDLTTKKSC